MASFRHDARTSPQVFGLNNTPNGHLFIVKTAGLVIVVVSSTDYYNLPNNVISTLQRVQNACLMPTLILPYYAGPT